MSRSIIRHKNPRGKLTHPSQGQELESAGRFTDQTKNSISSKKCEKVLYVTVIYTTPDIAYVSIFTDSDLTHITEDHLEIKLTARLFNKIYVVQPPMLPPRYDDAPPDEYEYSQPHTSTDGARPSAPEFPEHLHSLLTHS